MADAEAVVRDLMAGVAAERGLPTTVEVHPLSSGGGNYTSALFTAKAGDLKVFAKVALIGEKMREAMNAETLFKTEQIVYAELAKTFDELQKRFDAKLFRFPVVYATLATVGSETVLMEDLGAQGYRTPSRHRPIDWQFASAAVQQLAAFHALSFAYESEDPEGFKQMAARLNYVYEPPDEGAIQAAFGKIIQGAIEVVKDEYREKLVALLSDKEGYVNFKKPLSKTVFSHGDYRASNLLFKEQDNGELDVMVVDYQTVHSGCPVTDLLYFIFMGTDQQFRRSHYDGLLDHYHTELGAAMKRLGVDVRDAYPRNVFEKEVKEMLPRALQMSVFVLPLVLVDEAAAPTMGGDADLSTFALAPTNQFAERFAALVEDCAAWGVL